MTSVPSSRPTANPILNLDYEPALELLGDDYYDIVAAAEFPAHRLRFRNDDLLAQLGLDPQIVSDEDVVAAFGQFQQPPRPFLALRYHGHQFGQYNPFLGDGRGFLYGQVRGPDGELYDFGTKGSGRTPYSRTADGRLTLKGGVREVIAAESLHYQGVRTSRCLSLVETGEQLWRGDEPSPTRSSVMVRMSRSHIRFGTFERLHYFGRKDLVQILLDHVIEQYYPHLIGDADVYARFYAELVQRVAKVAAQWMSAGFCHGVLNTDNMSITGESFDYGPYGFIPTYDRRFTAAYFDYSSRYAYGNQPIICRLNLELLQIPLKLVIPVEELETGLAHYTSYYQVAYRQRMMHRLGFGSLGYDHLTQADASDLLDKTLTLLQDSQVGYHDFFADLRRQFSPQWREDAAQILAEFDPSNPEVAQCLENWRTTYQRCLAQLANDEMEQVAQRLRQHNPTTVPVRPLIEAAWEPIVAEDNWQPFHDLLHQIRNTGES